MAQQVINIGPADAKQGDNLFEISHKVNANNNELFAREHSSISALQNMEVSALVDTTQLAGYVSAGDGGAARYKRVAAEPAHPLKVRSADRYLPGGSVDETHGGWWEIDEPIFHVEMAGAVSGADSSAAFQRAADYAQAKRIGRIYLRQSEYLAAGVQYGPFTIWTAVNRGGCRIRKPDGASTFGFKTVGFDDWADGVADTASPVSNSRT